MNNTTQFGRFNWDISNNILNGDFMNEFMNVFPMPPRSQNAAMNFNPFLNAPNNSWAEQLTNSFLERNPYKRVTTDTAIEKIKKIKYENNLEQKECPITMMGFEEGEEIAELPCKHLFNNEAINRWLKDENYKCPVCRYELEYKEVKKYDLSGIDISDNILSSNMIDLSNVGINTLFPNSTENNFETMLINMIQNQIRSNYQTNHFSQMINEIESELDMSYDDDMQQVLWDSMKYDT